jgi:hypothetical protein
MQLDEDIPRRHDPQFEEQSPATLQPRMDSQASLCPEVVHAHFHAELVSCVGFLLGIHRGCSVNFHVQSWSPAIFQGSQHCQKEAVASVTTAWKLVMEWMAHSSSRF